MMETPFHEGTRMTSPANSTPLRASHRSGVVANSPVATRTPGDSTGAGDIFCFGRCRLIVRERLLFKDDAPVNIGSRAFDLLLALLERAGDTVNSHELFERVWPDVVVAKGNLRVHVAGLRKALGDGQGGNRFIVSVAGRGYRFVASVDRLQSTLPISPPVPVPSMHGRGAVAAMLSSQLSRKRVISLSGPGAWGHTNVAFAIAHTLAADFDDAVCFVDLAGVQDPARVAKAVAAAIGCELEAQPSLNAMLRHLHDKKMLLAIDNCEQVFAGVMQLAERLFMEAPLVQILISSREALQPREANGSPIAV